MKNMKKLLSVMAALGFTTLAATNVVACNNNSNSSVNHPQQFNSKVAETLGWYDTNGESLIEQDLIFSTIQKKPGVGLSESTARNLVDDLAKLLDGNKPVNDEAKGFLSDLGFNVDATGSYDFLTVKLIKEEIIIVPDYSPASEYHIGAVSVNPSNTGFTITKSTIVINFYLINKKTPEILKLKSYVINLAPGDLDPKDLTQEIFEKENLKLDATTNFKAGGPTTDFKLQFNQENLFQTILNNLLIILHGTVTLTWYSDDQGLNPITTFPAATEDVYLKVSINNVAVTDIIDLGNPVT